MEKVDKITPIKRLFSLLKVDKQSIMSIYIYALFSGIIALSLPVGIQAIINLISGGQISTSWILLVVFVILGVAFNGVMQVMQLSITESLQQKIFTRSAFEFAYRIPKMRLESLNRSYIPELVNRFFDTLSVQKGLSKMLIDFSGASLQVIFGLILLSLYHPFFILFSIVLIALLYLIFKYTIPHGIKTSLVESKYKYEVAHWLEEVARAMETFKLAGNSPLPLEKTDEAVAGYLKARKAHFKTLLTQYINLIGFKVIVVAGLLLIGGMLVMNQQMNIGQFVASEIIIIIILNSVEKLTLSMETIYDVLTAIEKIGAVTDIPLERDNGTSVTIEDDKGLSIHMKNLSYRFSDAKEDVLKNLNLHIQQGEKICLAGPNGAGKSIFLQLIAGLYDEFNGALAFNGIPLGNWCKHELHSIVGDNLVKGDIFKGSLEENISLGRPGITIDQIHKIISMVGLEEFIRSLPEGFETPLIPEGKNLPKSVRLRILLARTLVGTPRLILLEDSFNQLLSTNKEKFLQYLLEHKWTVIAISNDPEVHEKFEKSIVLKDGEIKAFKSIKELKSEDWYNSIFQNH